MTSHNVQASRAVNRCILLLALLLAFPINTNAAAGPAFDDQFASLEASDSDNTNSCDSGDTESPLVLFTLQDEPAKAARPGTRERFTCRQFSCSHQAIRAPPGC